MLSKIDSFSKEYRFMTNFYPCEIEFDGNIYSSVEHAYCASKTVNYCCSKEQTASWYVSFIHRADEASSLDLFLNPLALLLGTLPVIAIPDIANAILKDALASA